MNDKSGKGFLLKLGVFLAPFALIVLAETTILPIDAFSFRAWEALSMSNNRWINQFAPNMPFYPSRRLEKVETGDLGHHTRFAQTKRVVWETDDWGFRNGNGAGGAYDVVIIGDSLAAGSALSQDETLAATLERQSGFRSYTYAPGKLQAFLREDRFRTAPRPVVVYELFERSIVIELPWLDELDPVRKADSDPDASRPGAVSRAATAAVVALDRYCKGAMLFASRARLREMTARAVFGAVGVEYVAETPALGAVVGEDDRTLFLLGGAANRPMRDSFVTTGVERLREFDRAFRESGFRFVVLPVPNKENIYYDLTSEPRQPKFLDAVITQARAAGLEVVDLQPAFRDARERGVQVFHFDDTHWTAEGVRIAARELARELEKPPATLSSAQ